MKAWILDNIGKIEYREVELPELKEDEVLVHVKAAGICGSDIPRIYRDGAHHMPLMPGHEFSGEIVQLGKSVEECWLHKRVGVYPLIPCRACIACEKGAYEMCRHYSYLGSRQDGGFAEYVAVPVKNVLELPINVSFVQAAMLEPMSVAVHAIRRTVIKQEDMVVVYGLGTIGMFLVMFLLEQGVSNILAVGNKAIQKDMVVHLGLPEENFCNCKDTEVLDWMREKGYANGVDVVFECVGKMETLWQAVVLATISGKVCTVGNPDTDMTLQKDIYWKILRNQLTIVGTWNSVFFKLQNGSSDWEYVLEKLKNEKIFPQELITHRFAMKNLEQGLHIMRDKTEDYIKIMMIEE